MTAELFTPEALVKEYRFGLTLGTRGVDPESDNHPACTYCNARKAHSGNLHALELRRFMLHVSEEYRKLFEDTK